MTPVTNSAGWARASLVAALLIGTALPAFAQETIGYTYDGQGRLVKVDRTGSINGGTSECYTYDAAGNRVNINVDTNGACTASGGGGGGTGGLVFSISSNGPVTEGTSSVFTITKAGTGSGFVKYASANGTAIEPGDYTKKSLTTLSFTTNQTSKTVSVTTKDDTLVESPETFTLTLSAPSGGATIATGTATGTINDNDGGGGGSTCSGVSYSISGNGAVTEGATSGFTVTKSGTTSISCTVSYATANGSAAAPGDYTAKSLTVMTFTSGQTSQTVNVTTIDDSVVESAETFTMTLSAPSGGSTIGTGTATATINDNDGGGGGGNSPPVAIDDGGYSQATCSLDYYDVLTNDSDPDGDALTITGVSGTGFSVSGTLIQFSSRITAGDKTGTYTISDGHGGTDSATLTVSVYDDGSCNTLMAPDPGTETSAPLNEPPADSTNPEAPTDPPPDATEPPPGGAS